MSLNGKTLFITGASRGIGREIALKAAADGANIVVAAKSAEAHAKLPGTIFSVAEEIVAAGGQALPLQLDVRDEDAVKVAMARAAEHFGGIDALINNAGAIRLKGVEHLEPKRYDLMFQINTRAVMVCSQAALPYLKQSQGHILSLSPPLNLDPKWFASYGPYTTTKYGMSMLTLGMHEEFRKYGSNRIAEGKLPLCAEMCSTKALLAGDANIVSDIYRKRVVNRAASALVSGSNLQKTGFQPTEVPPALEGKATATE